VFVPSGGGRTTELKHVYAASQQAAYDALLAQFQTDSAAVESIDDPQLVGAEFATSGRANAYYLNVTSIDSGDTETTTRLRLVTADTKENAITAAQAAVEAASGTMIGATLARIDPVAFAAGNTVLLYTVFRFSTHALYLAGDVAVCAVSSPQVVTVQWNGASSVADASFPNTHNVALRVQTSDALTVAVGATVVITDTANAPTAEPTDYSYAEGSFAIPMSTAHNATLNVGVTLAGANNPLRTMDLDLSSPTGCELGAQTNHEVTLQDAGA